MSTKTTIKRIALVAVSALGLGMVSTVAPAIAASTDGSISVIQATSGRLNAPVLLKVTMPFTTDSDPTGASDTVTVLAKMLTAAPGGSTQDLDSWIWNDWNSANLWTKPTLVATAGGANEATDAQIAVTNTADDAANKIVITPSALSASTAYTATMYASFTPDKVGVWSWVVWSDSDGSGTLNGTETSSTVSVTVDDSVIKTITVTSVGGTSVSSGSTAAHIGDASLTKALVKVSLTGADGLPAIPKTTEYLVAKVTTGAALFTKLNDDSSTTDYICFRYYNKWYICSSS